MNIRYTIYDIRYTIYDIQLLDYDTNVYNQRAPSPGYFKKGFTGPSFVPSMGQYLLASERAYTRCANGQRSVITASTPQVYGKPTTERLELYIYFYLYIHIYNYIYMYYLLICIQYLYFFFLYTSTSLYIYIYIYVYIGIQIIRRPLRLVGLFESLLFYYTADIYIYICI